MSKMSETENGGGAGKERQQAQEVLTIIKEKMSIRGWLS